MDIKAKNSDKTILEVNDDEYVLIQYLLEKNAKKNQMISEDNLSKNMFEALKGYDLG